jgi:hypothetical protein
MEFLRLLLERTESDPRSSLSSYRQLIIRAIRDNSSFDLLVEEILLLISEDIPSENHVRHGVHAAHVAMHGGSASASAHASTVSEDVINDLLDNNMAAASMASASGSNTAVLENRVRFLESVVLEANKRQRTVHPCKFWGVNSTTGQLSCSREVATGNCPFANHHDPTVRSPAADIWVPAAQFLASQPSPYGVQPVPLQPPSGAAATGQPLRQTL